MVASIAFIISLPIIIMINPKKAFNNLFFIVLFQFLSALLNEVSDFGNRHIFVFSYCILLFHNNDTFISCPFRTASFNASPS